MSEPALHQERERLLNCLRWLLAVRRSWDFESLGAGVELVLGGRFFPVSLDEAAEFVRRRAVKMGMISDA